MLLGKTLLSRAAFAGFFLGTCCVKVSGSVLPMLCPLSVPSGLSGILDLRPSAEGYVLAGGNAAAMMVGNRTVVWPHLGVMVALPLPGARMLVAGQGFCSIISSGGLETKIVPEGNFTSGDILGDTAVVAGPTAACAVRNGAVLGRLELSGKTTNVYVHAWGGKLAVFSLRDGVFVWDGLRFSPAGPAHSCLIRTH